VGEDQRSRFLGVCAGVNEVNALPVDRGREIRLRVDLRLVRARVIASSPVLNELPEVVDTHAVVPACVWELLRPPGLLEPTDQVVELCLVTFTVYGVVASTSLMERLRVV
jgi:hypothetical protein